MMKKYCSLFMSIILLCFPIHAKTLYKGKKQQTPLEVVTTFLHKELPYELEVNDIITLQQTQAPCSEIKCQPRTRILVTQDNLADDSVKAIRHILLLEQENQYWKIIEQEKLFQCYHNRGHQDFSEELCL